MLGILTNSTYAKLFSAQVLSLLGTGLLTVALSLLAFDLAGDRAGAVLGAAYAIKMVAYVGLAPVASALVERLPRRPVLVAADLLRASVVVFLPFVDAVWQIYVLIFVLQAASATFTPAFQATIPDVLTEERDYTRALSLSRLAYDLENLLSPMLAGLLLAIIAYNWLFLGTTLGFVGSAGLILLAAVPGTGKPSGSRPFMERLTRGTRIYLATPRLRGLLALNLAAAAAGAFVLVNTVVLVQAGYGAGETAVAYALAAFGGGSMVAAMALPAVLERLSDRPVMVRAASLLTILTVGHGLYLAFAGRLDWGLFLAAWALTGMLYASILTPSGRLLRKSAHREDRPALFAAQFALSHACWLLTYPLAGWAGDVFGLGPAMTVLGLIALGGVLAAVILWPAREAEALVHGHSDLPPDHPHLREHGQTARRHKHVFVIDDEHRAWPTNG